MLALLLIAQIATARVQPVGAGPYAAIVASNMADLASSLYGERHGLSEGNPLNFDTTALVMNKMLTIVVDVVIVRALSEHHPKLARAVGYIAAVPPGFAAAHNMLLAHR